MRRYYDIAFFCWSRSAAAQAHKAQGGDFKIQSQKIKIEAKSKIGSLDKITHKAGGGNVKIHNQRLRYYSTDYST